MPYPLVDPMRFSRSEFVDGVECLPDTNARIRSGPRYSIRWMNAHLGVALAARQDMGDAGAPRFVAGIGQAPYR